MAHLGHLLLTAHALLLPLALAAPATAGPLSKEAARCQKQVGVQGRAFKTAYLGAWQTCLDGLLAGKGCNTAKRDGAIGKAERKLRGGLAKRCPASVLSGPMPAGVGFPTACTLKPGPLSSAEAACAALPASDPAAAAACIGCWKKAELNQLLAILYPCLSNGVPSGSAGDCAAATPPCPAPGDKDAVKCLRSIAAAGIDVFLAREAAMETCLDDVRAGKQAGPCPDAAAQKAIAAAQKRSRKAIARCDSVQAFWPACPEDVTPPCGPDAACDQPIATPTDVATCIDTATAELAAETVCQQYPAAEQDADPARFTCPEPVACCGDGVVNGSAEQCDPPGSGCGAGGRCNSACICTEPVIGGPCGNGVVDVGEDCDPAAAGLGGVCAGDGSRCPNTCRCACGDGVVDPGERCDPAANPPANACPFGVGLARNCNGCDCSCQNGALDPGEQCDPTAPGAAPCPGGAACTANCECTCGDGIKGPGEECDPSSAVAADRTCPNGGACNADCTCYACGNTRLDPIEQCDPTAPASLLNCPDRQCGAVGAPDQCTCLCGNGRLDAAEVCDRTAQREPDAPVCPDSKACEDTCTCTCGNGVVDAGEECDVAGPPCPGSGEPCGPSCLCPDTGSTTTTTAVSTSTSSTNTTTTAITIVTLPENTLPSTSSTSSTTSSSTPTSSSSSSTTLRDVVVRPKTVEER